MPFVIFAGLILLAGAVWSRPPAGSNFDRVKEADKKVFSKRFEKEVWPLMKRNGKDGCVGCHTPKHRSALRYSGNADKDFRNMLKSGFLLPDDPGSALHLVQTNNSRTKMPPGNRKRWTKTEIEVFRKFVVDLDKKQQKAN